MSLDISYTNVDTSYTNVDISYTNVNNYHDNKPCKFYTDSKICVISDLLLNNKIWEPWMHQVFEKYINKDSIVIEGGCHIGSHTCKLALLGKHVYGFEPLPYINQILRNNISLNDLRNVTIFSQGLSNAKCRARFDSVNYGRSFLENNPTNFTRFGPDMNLITVDCIAIDDLKLEKVDFIKLDIEGYETRAILGAMETIKRCKPVISIEVWSSQYGTFDINFTKFLFRDLIDIGYNVEHINDADFLFIPKY